MAAAIAAAHAVHRDTAPNPWVGAVVVTLDGRQFTGATAPPGGPHAEVTALAAAGADARGATLYVTLEPCAHHGRTPPCVDAIVAAGIARVVVAIEDPDPQVAGRGVQALAGHGLAVEVGLEADVVREQLAPYLTHRTRNRPLVTLKLASTLDGRTAAPDGSSRWITGPVARTDVHRLRAEHDAVLVGAGTVRDDDPELTVREVEGRDPLRVVLGSARPDAKVQPALELSGDLGDVLGELARRGVLSVLVEGGATVAKRFHAEGLVDRYVLYLAPALLGGDDGRPLFSGPGAATIGDAWRGRIVGVHHLGPDLRVDLLPPAAVA
ncbi:MAG: bifunctional diaminohydroxyphosphoribosylaminopyrimidine deaminase/5-amino-6-(5-phosphoribosylamino)uracil reductase RibD [Acidimicrobiales bacterium]